MIPLRPYQLEGFDALRERIAQGLKRLLFVLATGGGKTVVASHLVASALECASRVLFVAHRRELIKQCFVKLVRNGIDPRSIGIVMAGVESKLVDAIAPAPETLTDDEVWKVWARRRPTAPVQVASVDTLRVRAKPLADLIIIDEAHRALAASYVALFKLFPDAVHIGLTATPYRADGRGLGETYEDLVVVATPKMLIAEGFLVEPRVFNAPPSAMPDLSGVRMRGGDYDERELADAVDRASLVGDIVEHWKKHIDGVRTVAFAASVEHSKHIAERFREAGVAAEHIDGTTPTAEREAVLARLDRGETLVVSNCGVLCEGWDQPSVKGCILARPTKSLGLYLQMAGRILRPWNDARAVILDHAGAANEHGLPQFDREFSLKPPPKKKRGTVSAPATKTCTKCFAVLPSAVRECPVCGEPFVVAGKKLEEIDGELVEVDAAALEAKRGAFDAVVAEWRAKNAKRKSPLKPAWVIYRYKDLHGEKPPAWCRVPELDGDEQARRDRFDALRASGHSAARAHAIIAARSKSAAPKPSAFDLMLARAMASKAVSP